MKKTLLTIVSVCAAVVAVQSFGSKSRENTRQDDT